MPTHLLVNEDKLSFFDNLGLTWRRGPVIGVTPRGMGLLDGLLGAIVPEALVAH